VTHLETLEAYMVRERKRSDGVPLYRQRRERVERDEVLKEGEARMSVINSLGVSAFDAVSGDGRTGAAPKTQTRVTAYLDDVENAWLNELADEERVSRSAYLRQLVIRAWRERVRAEKKKGGVTG
jgi:hypothetical protein